MAEETDTIRSLVAETILSISTPEISKNQSKMREKNRIYAVSGRAGQPGNKDFYADGEVL